MEGRTTAVLLILLLGMQLFLNGLIFSTGQC